MPAEPSPSWIIGLNVAVFLALQLGLAWLLAHWPTRLISSPAGWRWEADGQVYVSRFALRRWRGWLPDGGPLVGGSSKRLLPGRSLEQLRLATLDARRGELCHLLAVAGAVIFFGWNPPWAGMVVVAVAVALNLPCWLSQRATRLRLRRIVQRRGSLGERYTVRVG